MKTQKKGQDQHPVEEFFVNALILSTSLLVSVGVAIFLGKTKFDRFQTITISMLSFLCVEYCIHSLLLKSKYFKAKKEYSLVEQANDWTGKLYEMSEYCKTIIDNSHGAHDLFIITCKKNIDNLYYILRTAAQDEKIEICNDFIINSVGVFDALNVSSDKRVEMTFPIDNIQEGLLPTAEDKKFFETSLRMIENGDVAGIRVLLILGDCEMINDPQLKALCRFYETNKGFEGKYISKADFIKACESNMISSSQIDFGIYGPRMLFRVVSYNPYKGIYTKNESEVVRYRKLFDEMWNFSSMTHPLPLKNEREKAMSLEELFDTLSKTSLNEVVASANSELGTKEVESTTVRTETVKCDEQEGETTERVSNQVINASNSGEKVESESNGEQSRATSDIQNN